MNRILKSLIALGTLGSVLSACSITGSAAAPEPGYTVISSEGDIQIRDYKELVVVRTPMDGKAFSRLFDYISGSNTGSRKIAMTAPVLQSEEGDKIAMTAPVLETSVDGKAREMFFILPDEMSFESAPLPSDPAVTLDTIPARRVASITFNGRLTDNNIAEHRQQLDRWIAEKELVVLGPTESAGYNPPWTLPTYRRNEVLVPIEGF